MFIFFRYFYINGKRYRFSLCNLNYKFNIKVSLRDTTIGATSREIFCWIFSLKSLIHRDPHPYPPFRERINLKPASVTNSDTEFNRQIEVSFGETYHMWATPPEYLGSDFSSSWTISHKPWVKPVSDIYSLYMYNCMEKPSCADGKPNQYEISWEVDDTKDGRARKFFVKRRTVSVFFY